MKSKQKDTQLTIGIYHILLFLFFYFSFLVGASSRGAHSLSVEKMSLTRQFWWKNHTLGFLSSILKSKSHAKCPVVIGRD